MYLDRIFLAAAVYILKLQCKINKIITDYVAVYTAELIALMLALKWVEDVHHKWYTCLLAKN